MPCVDPDFPTKCPGFCRRFGKPHINEMPVQTPPWKLQGPEAEKLNRSDETFNLALSSHSKSWRSMTFRVRSVGMPVHWVGDGINWTGPWVNESMCCIITKGDWCTKSLCALQSATTFSCTRKHRFNGILKPLPTNFQVGQSWTGEVRGSRN